MWWTAVSIQDAMDGSAGIAVGGERGKWRIASTRFDSDTSSTLFGKSNINLDGTSTLSRILLQNEIFYFEWSHPDWATETKSLCIFAVTEQILQAAQMHQVVLLRMRK